MVDWQWDSLATVHEEAHDITVQTAMLCARNDSLGKFRTSSDNDQQYKDVDIVKKDDDEETFNNMRRQFFQSLIDNFEQRFPPADFLQTASCLNSKV